MARSKARAGALTGSATGILAGGAIGLLLGGLCGAIVGAVVARTAGATGGVSIGAYTGMGTGALLGGLCGAFTTGLAQQSQLIRQTTVLDALSQGPFEAAMLGGFLVAVLGTAVGAWLGGHNFRARTVDRAA